MKNNNNKSFSNRVDQEKKNNRIIVKRFEKNLKDRALEEKLKKSAPYVHSAKRYKNPDWY